MECPACHQPNIDGARFCATCGALLPVAPVEADPLIGAIVGGRFRIIGVLGEGGMGRVYDGEQPMGTSVRKVAIKTLLSAREGSAGGRALHAGVRHGQRARAPEHHQGLRLRADEHRGALHRDGAPQRAVAGDGARAGRRARSRARRSHHRADVRVAPGGPREGDRPPRPEARQHLLDQARRRGRLRQGPRLRHREARRAQRQGRAEADPAGDGARHPAAT